MSNSEFSQLDSMNYILGLQDQEYELMLMEAEGDLVYDQLAQVRRAIANEYARRQASTCKK